MILVISPLTKTKDCVQALQEATKQPVEICSAMPPAIALLQSREFSAVVLDQLLLDAEPDEGEAILKHLGTAVPVYLNFAVSGIRRVAGELRTALQRRERDMLAARKAAEQALRHELRDSVTALLLSCETALQAEDLQEVAETKMQEIEALARKLGEQLEAPA